MRHFLKLKFCVGSEVVNYCKFCDVQKFRNILTKIKLNGIGFTYVLEADRDLGNISFRLFSSLFSTYLFISSIIQRDPEKDIDANQQRNYRLLEAAIFIDCVVDSPRDQSIILSVSNIFSTDNNPLRLLGFSCPDGVVFHATIIQIVTISYKLGLRFVNFKAVRINATA